jgi:hypothetical protein
VARRRTSAKKVGEVAFRGDAVRDGTADPFCIRQR